MASTAIYPFGRRGRQKIYAAELHSHEHARKFWPLLSEETEGVQPQHMAWVRPYKRSDGVPVKAHFKAVGVASEHLLVDIFVGEEERRRKALAESAEHARAKALIADALTRRMERGLGLEWHYTDPSTSDFHFSGNLLSCASRVACEHTVATAFGKSYRLDVAILAAPLAKNEQVVAGVEIEWEHAFDGRKAMLARSQAFVLISVDIKGMALGELTEAWADQVLTKTTHNNPDGQRRSFIYLHDLLYPLYQRIPAEEPLAQEPHQLIIFASDGELATLSRRIAALRQMLAIGEGVHVQICNAKSDQARSVVEHHGAIVGKNWERVNSDRFMLLTIPRIPVTAAALTRFYLCLATLLLTQYSALVGYKYEKGLSVDDSPEADVWWRPALNYVDPPKPALRILPKRLAIPKEWWLDLTERGVQ